MLSNFCYNNIKLFFVGYLFIKLVQKIEKVKFFSFIIVSDFYYNLV